MESSQPPLSIESFSQRWLINFKSSFDDSHVDDQSDETASFIEFDPKLTPSKRFLSSYAADFSFNFTHSPPLFLVHADELFSNGIVMPIFINPSKIEASDAIKAPPTPSSSSQVAISEKESSVALIPFHKDEKSERPRCRRSSRWIFQKYVSFFKPLFQKVGRKSAKARSTSKGNSIDRICESSCSPQASPRIHTFSSTTDSCDIDEAVLHCKKSFDSKMMNSRQGEVSYR